MTLNQSRNLGQTSLRRTRRCGGPMQSYDALPAPLRQWLRQAALPWSPVSAKRIWKNAQANGRTVEDALSALSEAEARTLSRDRYASQYK